MLRAVETHPVLVIGGGISGLAFAWHAARAGQAPLVLEASGRLGGCLDSRRGPADYWFELGAHTLYNSYGALLEIAEGCPTPPTIVARGDARKRFGLLRAGGLTTMGPLSVFRQFGFWELVTSAPRGLFGGKGPRTIREHFSRLVGARNYAGVLAPFLSAVPSQAVDDFPASGPGSLFKKRPRRKDVTKSFTFAGGVGAIATAITGAGVAARLDAPVATIARADGGYRVELADGTALAATRLGVATDPATAARLLAGVHPEVAAAAAALKTVEVESIGVVVERAAVALPPVAFVVPADDVFWSVVTRDPVPDEHHRAFTFHFKPGVDRAARLRRIGEVLGVEADRLLTIEERRTTLPAPARDHAAAVAAIDQALAGLPLALLGNYFAGLAIEDCAARAKAEWARLAGATT
ncbi:MAG: FAD-dependent oxidoreductase [Myxococcales bacterium]|nr:FAD-dependent oxidoreductase [Myxococcales bacterium]